MPYRNLFESSTGLRIEVEGNETSSEVYLPALLSSVSALASALGGQVAQLPKDARPDEFQVSFGLKALATGGFAVALDYDAASFRLTLKWGGEGGGLAGLTMPMPKKPGV